MARRKLLGWMCAAALAVTAWAVPALAAGTSITGPADVSAGEQISIAVTTTSSAFTGEVETEGLRVVSVSHDLCTKGDVVLADHFENGSVTYTCAVTGSPGDTVSFGVTNAVQLDNGEEKDVYVAPWSTRISGGTSASDEPDDDPTPRPTNRPAATKPGTSGAGPADIAEPTEGASATSTASSTAAPSSTSAATVVRSPSGSGASSSGTASPSGSGAAVSSVDDDDGPIGPSAREPSTIIAPAPAGRPTSASATNSATVKPGSATASSTRAAAKANTDDDEDNDHLPSSGDVTTSIWTLTLIGIAAAILAIVAWRKVLSQL